MRHRAAILIWADLRQPYQMMKVALTCAVIAASAMIGNYTDLSIMLSEPGKCYAETVFLYLAQTSFFLPLVMIMAAFLGAVPFCIDRNCRRFASLFLRIPVRTYLIARAVECFLLSFLSIFTVSGCFLAICALALPGSNLAFALYIIVDYSIAVSFWCMCGLFSSVFLPNYYVTLTAPFVLSYLVGRLSYSLLPQWYNPNNYMQSLLFVATSADRRWLICVCCVLGFTGLSFLVGSGFVICAEKALQDEI